MRETYVVHVTKKCNCDCVYCYEKDKDSLYTKEEVLSYAKRLLEHRTGDEFLIEFLGGEPMLAWDLICAVYEFFESQQEVYIPSYIITTNGTILNEEILTYLQQHPKLHIAASLDGHIYANQLRVFKESRKNTYEAVIQNLHRLQEHGISCSIHMVTHPYNIAFLADSVEVLYAEGVRRIGLGTVESTMLIDEDYCDRFITECDLISKRMVRGDFPGLSIAEFEGVKPKSDVRSYIRDENGKLIGESYGRSGEDITAAEDYHITRCTEQTSISEQIYRIRKAVYDQHQQNLRQRGRKENER